MSMPMCVSVVWVPLASLSSSLMHPASPTVSTSSSSATSFSGCVVIIPLLVTGIWAEMVRASCAGGSDAGGEDRVARRRVGAPVVLDGDRDARPERHRSRQPDDVALGPSRRRRPPAASCPALCDPELVGLALGRRRQPRHDERGLSGVGHDDAAVGTLERNRSSRRGRRGSRAASARGRVRSRRTPPTRRARSRRSPPPRRRRRARPAVADESARRSSAPPARRRGSVPGARAAARATRRRTRARRRGRGAPRAPRGSARTSPGARRSAPLRQRRARRARRPRSGRGSSRLPLLRFVVGFLEQLAQAREPGEHPALDRAEWLPEPLGELGLREATVVRELDRLALLVRKLSKRCPARAPAPSRSHASSSTDSAGDRLDVRQLVGAPVALRAGRGRRLGGARTS